MSVPLPLSCEGVCLGSLVLCWFVRVPSLCVGVLRFRRAAPVPESPVYWRAAPVPEFSWPWRATSVPEFPVSWRAASAPPPSPVNKSFRRFYHCVLAWVRVLYNPHP